MENTKINCSYELILLSKQEQIETTGGRSLMYRLGAFLKTFTCDCYVNSGYQQDSGSKAMHGALG